MSATQIFDSFLMFSDLAQRLDERRKLHNQNAKLMLECGNCRLWMTQQCKREASGRKVTCGDIKCSDFIIKTSSSNLILKNEIRIKELTP